jgi:hypothetical protein
MKRQTEAEELAAAARAVGRDLADITVYDDHNHRLGSYAAPIIYRYMATWGDYDLDCRYGTGNTPESAMWDLIDATEPTCPNTGLRCLPGCDRKICAGLTVPLIQWPAP